MATDLSSAHTEASERFRPWILPKRNVLETSYAVVAFAVALVLWNFLTRADNIRSGVALAIALAIAVLGAGLKLSDLTPGIRLYFKILLGYWIVYIVLVSQSHPLEREYFQFVSSVPFVTANTLWISLILCILGFVRPVAYVPLVAVQEMLWADVNVTMPYSAMLDRWPILDTPSLVLTGLVLFRLGQRFVPWLPPGIRPKADADGAVFLAVSRTLFLFSISLHFGNYLYAGVAKVAAGWRSGGGLFTWLLDNQTAELLLVGNAFGSSMITWGGAFLAPVYTLMKWGLLPLNAFVLLPQLLAVVAIASRRFTLYFTLLFDVLHFGIFLVTGLFFYKWMVLNGAVAAALAKDQRACPAGHGWSLGKPAVIMAVLIVILSEHLIRTPRLGWFDSAGVNVLKIYGVRADGSEVRLSPRYFSNSSFAVSGHWFIRPFDRREDPERYANAELGKFFSGIAWGNAPNYNKIRQRLDFCRALASSSGAEVSKPSTVTFTLAEGQQRFLDAAHYFAQQRLSADGHFPWPDLYPHHLNDNPQYYTDFWNADLRDIIRFRITFDASCLTPDGQDRYPVIATASASYTPRPPFWK